MKTKNSLKLKKHNKHYKGKNKMWKKQQITVGKKR